MQKTVANIYIYFFFSKQSTGWSFMTADKRRVCLFADDLYSPDESPADANANQFIIKNKA